MGKTGLRYGAMWLREALAGTTEGAQEQDPRQELRRYLQAPLSTEDVDDVVKWWGVSILFSVHASESTSTND